MSLEKHPLGERVIEEAYIKSKQGYAIYLMHKSSYLWAARWCEGKNILDYGCGTGYGSNIIAGESEKICAVDVSTDALDFARSHYSHPNLTFKAIESNQPLPFPSSSFDVVISFQVIEHIENDEFYISEASRVLKSGGVLLLITPDRKNRLFCWQQPWNRWHIREYSEKHLTKLIENYFHISHKLFMQANGEIEEIEMSRYKKTKWLTLPFTLPFYPYTFRRFLLNILGKLKKNTARDSSLKSDNEGLLKLSDIEFSEAPDRSLNLAFVLTKKDNEEK